MREQILVRLFVLIPFVALLAAVPVVWGGGLGWIDLALAVGFYPVACLGITVGYHRYFTHRAFKAKRAPRVALAVAGGLAAHGPVIGWVADHRRHHAFSDREGDPHSPWLFGTGPVALAKQAHVGWLFERVSTNAERLARDLLADQALRSSTGSFLWGVVSVRMPAVFWAGLVRAILSIGESWHNSHHADPTCARQIDISARVIWILEKLGWASEVRWTNRTRLVSPPGKTVQGTAVS